MSNNDEKCDRCGEVGEDRRTLSMECFYAMEELPIPFKQQVVLQFRDIKDLSPGPTSPVKIPIEGDKPITLYGGSVICEGELFPHNQYTLRVCKGCRAAWMEAIECWFKHVARPQETGTGVFIRKNGAVVELTNAEVKQFEKDRRFKPGRLDPVDVEEFYKVMGREPNELGAAVDRIVACADASVKTANELMAKVREDKKK